MEAVIVHQVSKKYPLSAALPPVGQMGKKEARLGQPALQDREDHLAAPGSGYVEARCGLHPGAWL